MNNTQNPRLRFPEFTGDWENKLWNNFVYETKSRNFGEKYDKEHVLSVSGEFGIVNQIEFKGRSFAGEIVTNYHIVENGDIVYTKSPLKNNPYGIIKANLKMAGIVSTLYAVYRCKDNALPIFIQYYFLLDDRINEYLRPLVRKGAKNDMKINNSDVLKGYVVFPSLPEQQKIAGFLGAVDEKLSLLNKKLSLMQDYKKGMMQKLFSQTIRFTDENNQQYPNWQEKKLGDVAIKKNQKNKNSCIINVLTNSALQGIVNQTDYFDKDIANQGNLEGYYIVDIDDFVYNPRISIHAPVGPIKRNNLKKGVMSPLYSIFQFSQGNLDFLEKYFETDFWHDYMNGIANFGARHDRMNITQNDFFKMPIPYPSLPEQQKIADFLSAIDEKINIIKQQIDQTTQFKKSLLQQMFV